MWRLAGAGAAGVLLAIGGLASGQEADPFEAEPDVARPAPGEWFQRPVRLEGAGQPVDSGEAWGHSGPWVEDVDGDGLRDLVVGDFSGVFRVYRNEGNARTPRYAAGVNLKAGNEDAKVPIY